MSEPNEIIIPASPATYGEAVISDGLSPETEALLKHYVRSSVLSQTGEGFLDGIVRLLWAEIDARLVLVGIVNDDEGRVDTRVTFRDGIRSSNYSYVLAGSPCETVVGPLQACVYPDHVAERFPEDAALADSGAESYVGLPLFDRLGNRIGVMVAISNSPMEQPAAVVDTMRFFARRAALELEQIRAVESAQADLEKVREDIASAEAEMDAMLKRLV